MAPDHRAGCGLNQPEAALAGIAWLELGDRRKAREAGAAAVPAFTPARLEDERQNLWRWAGDLPRAERAAREWDRSGRDDGLALLRIAEIEYLRGRHDAAARDFGAAARRARAATGTWSLTEAAALLARGGALLKSDRRDEALAAFAEADEIRLARRCDATEAPALALVSYHARAQLADAAREDGNVEAAAEHYASRARGRAPRARVRGRRSTSRAWPTTARSCRSALGCARARAR